MPSKQRGQGVGRTEQVETTREDGAGDSVQGGEIPCYLGAVDCEVGGDRAV